MSNDKVVVRHIEVLNACQSYAEYENAYLAYTKDVLQQIDKVLSDNALSRNLTYSFKKQDILAHIEIKLSYSKLNENEWISLNRR